MEFLTNRILGSVVNSLYSLYWDIFVDWRLFNNDDVKKDYNFLEFGRTLKFKKLFYFAAIIFNGGIKLFWILKISLFLNQNPLSQDISSIAFLDFTLRILEIVRRGIWVIFRFEREWITGGYGAI